jgi:hypothetical protein
MFDEESHILVLAYQEWRKDYLLTLAIIQNTRLATFGGDRSYTY